jgi:hypothetical protein
MRWRTTCWVRRGAASPRPDRCKTKGREGPMRPQGTADLGLGAQLWRSDAAGGHEVGISPRSQHGIGSHSHHRRD